jgi:formate dehydrogenase major subunit
MTNIDGVFAAGDGVTGPNTAIMAIAGGKKAAFAMNKYMKGESFNAEKENYNHVKAKNFRAIDPDTFGNIEKIGKIKMPMLTEEQRIDNFNEVELGFSEDQAKREAERCLECGCADADECKLRKFAAVYEADQFAFSGGQATHLIDNSHKHIVRDKNKCILCARCVRICAETGSGVFGFTGRGFDTTVEPPFSIPLGEDKNCISCGLCVSACPTGALTPREDTALPTTAYTDCEDTGFTGISDAVAQAKKA